jgi:3-hydroxybutyrate dehydrogenase
VTIAGKHVVISGGGSGVGAAMAREFFSHGARVTVLGRRLAPLEATAKGSSMFALDCDVADGAAVSLALDQARARHGLVSIAIANAGVVESKAFAQMQAQDLERMLSVNLLGVFNLWHGCLPDMESQKWGRLIAVASTAGLKGYRYVSGYSATKHAVIGLTKSLALELAGSSITVNALCPGFVETPMLERSVANIMEKTGVTEAGARQQLVANNPQGRFIQTDEIAGTALWLCNESSRSVTGQAIVIAGGEL